MHITDPLGWRFGPVLLFQNEILRYLFPDSHAAKLKNALKYQRICGGYRSRTGDLLHAMQTG